MSIIEDPQAEEKLQEKLQATKTRSELQRTTTISELYADGAAEGDYRLFGRVADSNRRGFLRGAGLGAMTALLGSNIPYHRFMPSGLIPVALADNHMSLPDKDGLTVLNDRPINAETPPHLLDDDITPSERHFVRNNGIPPVEVNASTWRLQIDGLVDNPMDLSIEDLKDKFKVYTKALLIECGGNGRAAFDPPAKGNQWTYGAVACSEWTGVRLKDVLKAAKVRDGAVYTAHYGTDTHLSGKAGKLAISRGVPISKAMDETILIAFGQNGSAISPLNGAPLRLVVPGWPGSCSQKWLHRIQIRDQVHDGPKMTGTAYRVPYYPVEAGEKVAKKDFEIIERMPVKSLITHPRSGAKSGESLEVRGHAWSGDRKVKVVHISQDFGATWQKARLQAPVDKGAWQNFSAEVKFPQSGYYEIWSRATDSAGDSQPHAIAWNPKGYLNNTLFRVAVKVS